MSTAFLKLSLILTLSFAVFLALIQSQPARETDLRAFLALPERCPSACLLGLRPGYTNVETALHTLMRHAWVGRITSVVDAMSSDSGEFSWTWSDAAPALIDTGYPGHAVVLDGVVQQVTVQTRVPLGFWQVLLGDPEMAALRNLGSATRYMQAFQIGGAIWQISVETVCPWSSAAYWDSPAQLMLASEPPFTHAEAPAAVIAGALCDRP